MVLILPDNIVRARDRMARSQKLPTKQKYRAANKPSSGTTLYHTILDTNIQLGDMLMGKDKIEFTSGRRPKWDTLCVMYTAW